MSKVLINGTVSSCELKRSNHVYGWRAYDKTAENYSLSAFVAVIANDGRKYTFYSPAVNERVSCPAGAPVAVVTVESNDWIDGEPGSGVVTRDERPAGAKSKIGVGDVISVNGKIKKETPYGTQLNFVKLVSKTEAQQ